MFAPSRLFLSFDYPWAERETARSPSSFPPFSFSFCEMKGLSTSFNWCKPGYSSTSGSAARKSETASDILSIFCVPSLLSFSLARNALVASDFLKNSVAANQAFESDTEKTSIWKRFTFSVKTELKRAFNGKIIWSAGQGSQSRIKRQISAVSWYALRH